MKAGQLLNLDIEKLNLDINNPRIKQFLEIYHGEITGEQIALALNDSGNDASASYQTLKESIKVSKGIIHPIIVNVEESGQHTVIEGNTRLQIYKEFHKANPSDTWRFIPSLVYENLSIQEQHSIRLQSHLVGPRDWDAYSKAKYLYNLSEVECLPMTSIISMCGGNATEINKLILAYKHMESSYRAYITENDLTFDPKDFSKFSEYQRKTIIEALRFKQHSDEDFSKWVADGNIDTAQNVRRIPEIFKDKKAYESFKKTNISDAIKKIVESETEAKINLENIPFEMLADAFNQKLNKLTFYEVDNIKNNEKYDSQKVLLETIKDIISDYLK